MNHQNDHIRDIPRESKQQQQKSRANHFWIKNVTPGRATEINYDAEHHKKTVAGAVEKLGEAYPTLRDKLPNVITVEETRELIENRNLGEEALKNSDELRHFRYLLADAGISEEAYTQARKQVETDNQLADKLATEKFTTHGQIARLSTRFEDHRNKLAHFDGKIGAKRLGLGIKNDFKTFENKCDQVLVDAIFLHLDRSQGITKECYISLRRALKTIGKANYLLKTESESTRERLLERARITEDYLQGVTAAVQKVLPQSLSGDWQNDLEGAYSRISFTNKVLAECLEKIYPTDLTTLENRIKECTETAQVYSRRIEQNVAAALESGGPEIRLLIERARHIYSIPNIDTISKFPDLFAKTQELVNGSTQATEGEKILIYEHFLRDVEIVASKYAAVEETVKSLFPTFKEPT